MKYHDDPVINAIYAGYAEDSRFATIPSIAAYAGVSVTTARKRIHADLSSAAPLLERSWTRRPFGRRQRIVHVYVPTRDFRESVNAARALASLTKSVNDAQQACELAIERRKEAQGTEAYHEAAAAAQLAYSKFLDAGKALASHLSRNRVA